MRKRNTTEMNMTFDALLFDMDGTLVDSTALVERTWADFAARRGISMNRVIAFAHGRPTAETVSHFVSDPFLARRETDLITTAESADVDGVVEIPGAADMLAQLSDQPWAIVTSAGRPVALARLEAAGLPLPRVLVTPEDTLRGKPAPDGYEAAARILGVDVTRCIIFEDAGPGVAAGRAAGATVVVVGQHVGSESNDLPRIADFVGVKVSGRRVKLGRPRPDTFSRPGVAGPVGAITSAH
jgi:sugar-phosphatase